MGAIRACLPQLSDKLQEMAVKAPGSTQRGQLLTASGSTAVSMAAAMQATVSSCNDKWCFSLGKDSELKLTNGLDTGYFIFFFKIRETIYGAGLICSHIHSKSHISISHLSGVCLLYKGWLCSLCKKHSHEATDILIAPLLLGQRLLGQTETLSPSNKPLTHFLHSILSFYVFTPKSTSVMSSPHQFSWTHHPKNRHIK